MSLADQIRARAARLRDERLAAEREAMRQRALERRARRRERRKSIGAAKKLADKNRKKAARVPLAPACEACGVDRRNGLCRHHLVPVAQGGSPKRHNIVTLCHLCHKTAHAIWGPGKTYCGPADRDVFVRRVREYVTATGSPGVRAPRRSPSPK